jgi:hypothetical protein
VTARRFPPPWSIEDIGAAFVIKDGTGTTFRPRITPVAQGA